MIKKILFFMTILFMPLAIAIAANNLSLNIQVKKVNEPNTYTVFISFNDLTNRSSIKVFQDGKEVQIGAPTVGTVNGQKNVLVSVTYPPSGTHTYKVDVLDSSGKTIASGTGSATVSSDSYQPPADTTSDSTSGGVQLGAPLDQSQVGQNVTFPEYISSLYTKIVLISVILAIIMIIYGGYRYMSSAGNPETLAEAKDIIIGSITALILIILAALILRAVSPDIVNMT